MDECPASITWLSTCKVVSFLQAFKKAAVEKQVSKPAGTPAERRNRFLQDVRCPVCFPGSPGVFNVDLSSDTNSFLSCAKTRVIGYTTACLYVISAYRTGISIPFNIQRPVHRNNNLTGLNMFSI